MDAVPLDWLRGVYDEWGRGNFRAGTEGLDPEFVFSTTPDFPDAVSGVPATGAPGFIEGFLAAWASLRIEAREIVVAGDRALVRVLQTGTGRASGLETSLEYFNVWRFRDRRAMSLRIVMEEGEAHAEQLRGLYDAWAAGDFHVGSDLLAPDIAFVTSEGFPDAPGPGEGLERVEQWRDQFLAAFEELRIEALELEAVGEQVLARVRQTGRFRTTGIDVDVTYFHLWSFRGGRAVRFRAFEPTAEAEARAATDQ